MTVHRPINSRSPTPPSPISTRLNRRNNSRNPPIPSRPPAKAADKRRNRNRRRRPRATHRRPAPTVSRRRVRSTLQISTKGKTPFADADERRTLLFSLQINRLEADVQRLSQTLEKQKSAETQLRTQTSELKSLRKDLDDLRVENTDLKAKWVLLLSVRTEGLVCL